MAIMVIMAIMAIIKDSVLKESCKDSVLRSPVRTPS